MEVITQLQNGLREVVCVKGVYNRPLRSSQSSRGITLSTSLSASALH